MNTFETIAARMLAREGMGIIWALHVRAAASCRRGNWVSAVALVGIADLPNGYGAAPREHLFRAPIVNRVDGFTKESVVHPARSSGPSAFGISVRHQAQFAVFLPYVATDQPRTSSKQLNKLASPTGFEPVLPP